MRSHEHVPISHILPPRLAALLHLSAIAPSPLSRMRTSTYLLESRACGQPSRQITTDSRRQFRQRSRSDGCGADVLVRWDTHGARDHHAPSSERPLRRPAGHQADRVAALALGLPDHVERGGNLPDRNEIQELLRILPKADSCCRLSKMLRPLRSTTEAHDRVGESPRPWPDSITLVGFSARRARCRGWSERWVVVAPMGWPKFGTVGDQHRRASTAHAAAIG